MRRGLRSAATALTLVLAPVTSLADRMDQEAVRQAVQSGEIRPLAEILAAVQGRLPGDLVGVEIERKKGRWLYEFRVVDGGGRLFDVYVDARSGEIERMKEK